MGVKQGRVKASLQKEEFGDKPLEEIIEKELSMKYKEVKRKVVYDRLTRHKASVESITEDIFAQKQTTASSSPGKKEWGKQQARRSMESQTSIVEP